MRKKRLQKTHCKRGHPRTPENLTKSLACKICTTALSALAYIANLQENRDKRNAYYASHKQEAKDRRTANAEGVAAYKESVKGRFNTLKGGAKARHISMELTIEEYARLVKNGVCIYCGDPLSATGTGLDRKISSLGYSISNCVPCCGPCNWIRGDDIISHEEMFDVVKLLKKLRGINVGYVHHQRSTFRT
jgi:hypothetical protein